MTTRTFFRLFLASLTAYAVAAGVGPAGLLRSPAHAAVAASRTIDVTITVPPGVTNSTDSPATVTYYVDRAAGNDANPGTAAAPWKTLTKAAASAQAGAHVIVKAGVYNESLRPANSGQAGKLIVFRSETPRGAIIDGQNSRNTGVSLQGRKYIRIEGFDIRYHTAYGVNVQDYYSTSAEGVELVNNYIHHTGNYTGWTGGGSGIAAPNLRNSLIDGNEIYYNGDSAIGLNGAGFQAANVTIRGNNIHYNGRDGITGSGTNIVIEYNRMYDNIHTATHQDCLELWMCNGIIVRYNIMGDYTQLVYGGMVGGMTEPFVNLQVYGNVFYNSKYWSEKGESCPGVFIDCRSANQNNQFRNIQIHSNTFLFLGRTPILLYGAAGMTMDDVRIYNNIFYQCGGTGGTAAYSIDDRFTNVRADYNCFTNVEPNLSGQDTHSMTTGDPRFVNYTVGAENFDVRLQTGSPCINRGLSTLPTAVNMPSTFVDIVGKVRPSGGNYDIGAYEY